MAWAKVDIILGPNDAMYYAFPALKLSMNLHKVLGKFTKSR